MCTSNSRRADVYKNKHILNHLLYNYNMTFLVHNNTKIKYPKCIERARKSQIKFIYACTSNSRRAATQIDVRN